MHRDMARTLDHHLNIMFPRTMSQFTPSSEFIKFRLVNGILHTAGTQATTETERHIIGFHDFADFIEMGIEEDFLMMCQTPLRHDRTATRDNAGQTVGRQRYIS